LREIEKLVGEGKEYKMVKGTFGRAVAWVRE